nr:hypothetical protein [Prevotella sp.]
MSSYFSTTHLFSVTYEFILSLVEKSPFILLKCLFKGSERAFKGFERAFKGSERTFKGFERAFKGSERTFKGFERTSKGYE